LVVDNILNYYKAIYEEYEVPQWQTKSIIFKQNFDMTHKFGMCLRIKISFKIARYYVYCSWGKHDKIKAFLLINFSLLKTILFRLNKIRMSEMFYPII